MKGLRNQEGFILTVIIIAVLVVSAYVAWNNFLQSEQGQEIQNTTNKVIDTIEDTTNAATQEGGLIDTITQ